MTQRRLEWLLRARGADLASWPEAERVAALYLLRQSAAAQLALADALALEEPPLQDPVAFTRMYGVFCRRLAPLSSVARGVGWGALLACAAAGLYAGLADGPASPPDLFASAQTVSFAALDP